MLVEIYGGIIEQASFDMSYDSEFDMKPVSIRTTATACRSLRRGSLHDFHEMPVYLHGF